MARTSTTKTYLPTNVRCSCSPVSIAAGLLAWTLIASVLPSVHAQQTDLDTPTSAGRVAQLETPIFRIPKTDDPPTIDGPMKEGEWIDASALSGFWYDFSYTRFIYMAPDETQVEVYAAYDDRYLYVAYSSPVYPQGSWLKSRGRFPDVTHHPRYGLIWDDHVELEIRPFPNNRKGFEMGLFKWFVNPSGTIADQYWSKGDGFEGEWNSKVRARSEVTADRWTVEMRIPFERMVHGNYAGKNKEGAPHVTLPPPPETAYRVWFTRGIGGTSEFFNVFDNHVWNTTKTKMILDPDTVSFQVNELGRIMEDRIRVEMTVKNHSDRSRTLRPGFFVESAAGTIYSSYDSPELENGLLELVPGETRQLTLDKPFPGITTRGNTLWFDVRTAGDPAKAVFRTRLIDFHAKDADMMPDDGEDFRSRRIDVIAEELRPPRRDFEVHWNYSKFHNRLGAVVDLGIRGASSGARRAVEAKLNVLDRTAGGATVFSRKRPIRGNFATFLADLPDLRRNHTYTLSVLLFDKNKKIVAERKLGAFGPDRYVHHVMDYNWDQDPPDRVELDPVREWVNHDLGREDVVWEPFEKMTVTEEGFETLKHRFTLAKTGLPAQIYIKPSERDLPLEARNDDRSVDPEILQRRGRGPQLRNPMRIMVTVNGKKRPATVAQTAERVRTAASELVYRSILNAGPVEVTLTTRYEVDGSMHCSMTYGADTHGDDEEGTVSRLTLVTDVAGPVNLVTSGIGYAGNQVVAGSDRWNATLPHEAGVVWDSADLSSPGLFYSQFVPVLFFGTGDRGFSWYATSDRNWELDRDGSAMTLSRNQDGDVTWRVNFVNHKTFLDEQKTLDFHVLTHPAKPKPDGYRRLSWLYRGDTWYRGFAEEPIELSDAYLKDRRAFAAGRDRDADVENPDTLRDDTPPWRQYGRAGNANVVATGHGRRFEQRLLHYFEKQIRIGRRHGWYWGYMKPTNGQSQNLAQGEAYLRDPDRVGPDEIPWQTGWTIDHMRRTFKRLARVFKNENVPQRNLQMHNHAATMYESFSWGNHIFGLDHRSYEIDLVTQIPNSLWRYQTHHFTGLVSRLIPGSPDGVTAELNPGDAKRYTRQLLGRALLCDVGVSFEGIHAFVRHVEQGTRLLKELEAFGYFDPDDTEFLPYWRNRHLVQIGEGRRRDAHLLEENEQRPLDHVYVTAYRRPVRTETGEPNGYKLVFVIMNEHHEPVRVPLHLLDPDRLLDGHNTLRAGRLIQQIDLPESLRNDLNRWTNPRSDTPVLKDLETGALVTGRIKDDRETYGPIWIPEHNYRLLFARSKE